jgi:hypothetical protein
VVSVERWAEIRRMRSVEGLAIREIRRRTGLHRETIRRALSSPVPPRYSRAARPSRLDGFREEIHDLLRGDPRIETRRILELLVEQGYEGGKSITYDYVREVRPFFVDQRTYQRTVYRPGDVLQLDLWQPKRSATSTSINSSPTIAGFRRILAVPHERQQLVALKRPRRGLRQSLARHLRRPKPDEPQEMIDRRQRQVHRRRRPSPLQLQMPLEIPDRVIPRERVGQRVAVPGRIGAEPLDEPGDLPGVLAARALRQRLAFKPHLVALGQLG